MQWLIDLVAARVIATIGIPPTFIDRGDAPLFDFSTINFTIDTTWHDLDLSAIVPAGAQTVSLFLAIAHTHVAHYCYFRTKGNASIFNRSGALAQVVNIPYESDMVVPCDANRVIQYIFEAGGAWQIQLTVKGWWL